MDYAAQAEEQQPNLPGRRTTTMPKAARPLFAKNKKKRGSSLLTTVVNKLIPTLAAKGD